MAFGAANVSAVTLTAPGTLEKNVTDLTITELGVTGPMNAEDMIFISSKLPNLQSLDLSQANIVASDGLLIGTVTRHPANTIPSNVFAGLPASKVVLPKAQGLIIKAGAFAGSALKSIDIPATVELVGDGAFAGCTALESATVGAAKIGNGAFSACPALATVSFSKAVAVPDNTFYGDAALQNVEGDFLSVGDRAFAGCASLTAFPFSASLSSIGNEAFMQSGIKTVDLTKCTDLDVVGNWAFAMMPNLTSLSLGNASQVGDAVAFACPKLTDFQFDVTEVPDFALTKTAVTDGASIIPENVEYIGRYAFSGLYGVSEIVLPTTLQKIDDHAMEKMTRLESIRIFQSVVPELGEDVWFGVEQSNVTLEVPAESIEDYESAEQWQNFHIVADRSDVDDMVDDATELSNLRARFDGDDLIVETNGVEIEYLALYNVGGQLLIAVEPMDSTIVVNTTGFGTKVFIVQAALADGRTAALKIAKR